MDYKPSTPRWNTERPFLTGRFLQEVDSPPQISAGKAFSAEALSYRGSKNPIGYYPSAVQELLVIDDLLFALVGIEGRYILTKTVPGKEDRVSFHIDASMDLALQEIAQRIFPLCENYLLINEFVESRSLLSSGLVNHAFAAALRAFLLHYQAMVAQLEHQFRLGRLSMQGMWFFCQPMMGPTHVLSIVIREALSNNLSGSSILDLLHNQAANMAGDNVARPLLEKMIQSASSPYLRILERWIYEGVIDDPYGEFFIAENKSLHKESLTQDYDAKYWQQRYTLKETIPSFLTDAAGTILTIGKYLNVMRESGHSVQVPMSEDSKLMSFVSHHYLECIKPAYDFASSELLNFIKQKYDILGKLRSMKHYFLLDQGDFLVHFMDIAREELSKRPHDINVEKLQSLLDLALRTTTAASDSCHEELTCCVENSSLLKRLEKIRNPNGGKSSLSHSSESDKSNVQSDPNVITLTGLETFSLSYKVQWPLSLVISRKALTKYQLIFRFLFHCTHVNRQLCGAWQVHQSVRALDMLGTAICRSSLLCRSMLKFINSLLHYLTFEVIEPNWHVMHGRLLTAKSIDEVIQFHDFFLDKCLKECLLLLPQLFKKVERLKSICLQYSLVIQRLVTSIFIAKLEPGLEGSFGKEKFRSRRSKTSSQPLKLLEENLTFTTAILKFEKEFNSELQSLGPILSDNSQAEPYLTHLAQSILGIRNDH